MTTDMPASGRDKTSLYEIFESQSNHHTGPITFSGRVPKLWTRSRKLSDRYPTNFLTNHQTTRMAAAVLGAAMAVGEEGAMAVETGDLVIAPIAEGDMVGTGVRVV